ncbi:hypothetical protein SDRG_04332 [Saprolegnia diclina VS20]|uniref:Uncharacterized protein n=1 Tax=Saprolegnia diclina (strain VS20) TaxID=1156394 RepID=T0QVD4_SAPDV|nr:hypothetical protein SDRG_04332 [Saprolegnia diclina VS20]EQC38631.1 hypothetical protein SDRG_04332 [Saprolegnia diclina VS20]|eukprot:XP_008608223.1 hypothetical protein SDRG_04332 [Saprolegnia diclina VS20]
MLPDVRAVVHEMAMLVHGTFGPRGREVLVMCPPAAPIMTSSGYTIFHCAASATGKANPISQLLLQTMRSLYVELGDGVTQFILMLDLSCDEMHRHASSKHAWATAFADLANALPALYATTCMPYATPIPVAFDPHSRQPSTELRDAAQAIVRTSLAGAFSAPAVAYLADMTVDWVFRTVLDDTDLALPTTSVALASIASDVLAEAKTLLLQLPTGALDESRIGAKHEFYLRHTSYVRANDTKSIAQRFVLFDGSLSGHNDATLVTVHVQAATALATSRASAMWALEKYVASLAQDASVNLLLCTGEVSPQVRDLCRRYGVDVFAYLETDDVLALAKRVGLMYVTSMYDHVTPAHIGTHTGALETLRIGGVLYTVFRHLTRAATTRSVPQLRLHGSTKGLTTQYYYAVKKALRVLCAWLRDGASLPGGLAPERAVAMALRTSRPRDLGASVLTHALLGAWSQLHENLAGVQTKATLRRGLEPLTTRDDAFLGWVYETRALPLPGTESVLASHHVRVGDPGAANVLHAASRSRRILEVVLDTLRQLARLDGIYAIKKPCTD